MLLLVILPVSLALDLDISGKDIVDQVLCFAYDLCLPQ